MEQDYPLEIIIVDNCSTDGTVEFVKENFPSVKIIERRENLGYGAGNNLGVKHAEGDYIVILNPDTIVEVSWLKELLKPLKENKLITTPKILIYDSSAINACGTIPHFTGLTFVRGLGAESNDYQKQGYVNGLAGCCFAIRKDDFRILGGFDENFFLYAEDSDLSWKANLNGFRVLYVPTSVIRHDYTLKVAPQKIYFLEKGRYMILRKYLSWKDFLLLFPSLLIVEVLTFGYAIKYGWEGMIYKFRAIKDGLTIKVNREKGDKNKLFKSLIVTIPIDQLTSNKAERLFKIFANKIFEWNFKVIQ